LVYITHIRKRITRRYIFILRSKITEKQEQVINFAEVRNFALHQRRTGVGIMNNAGAGAGVKFIVLTGAR